MRIRKYAEVLVTAGKLERHAELSESALLARRMEVTNLRQRPVTSLDELAGQRTRKMVRKDQILTYDAIEAIPDVEVGTEVTIVLSASLLRITAPGRCLQSGSAGEEVKVKNKATGKVLKARVIDSSSVAVDI
jgi:flagella basal body P-ring formation protein FlgA